MAYFEPYIDTEGVHVPTYYDLLEHLIEQYKTIFGEDVYLGEETPDYQMISIFAKCLNDYSILAVQAYNDRNPQYATGDALDTLVQMTGLTRRQPTASTVTLTLTGDEGTEILTGNQAVDEAGNTWTIDEDVTIPEEGSVTASATCDTLGAVVAPVGSISSIYTPIYGWEEVTNEVEADAGLDLESDAELRYRFIQSHSANANGIIDSLITGIRKIQDVTFVTIEQNDTGETNSDGIPAHSFCAIVDGGEDEDVAEGILRLKPPGVGTYGNVNSGDGIEVVDEYGNTNVIKFSRPESTTVAITVTIIPLSGYQAGTDEANRIDNIIKGSLIADINSLGIGKSWTVSMGYKDIYSQFDSSDIPVSIVSITSSNATNGIVECAYDHILHATNASITITVSGGG